MSPHLLFAGGDLDSSAVRFAQAHFMLPNLSYIKADGLKQSFPDHSLDGIFDVSTVHHFFSYSKPPFDFNKVSEYRDLVFKMLRPGGKYACRDFVRENWPAKVKLSLSNQPRFGRPPFANLSPAQLFEDFLQRFAAPHDSTLRPTVRPTQSNAEYLTTDHVAQNFMHRINYTSPDSVPAEANEDYMYGTLAYQIADVERAGGRVDYAAAIPNPWIISQWWLPNAVEVHDAENGERLDFPASNMVLFATKPGPKDPVRVDVKKYYDEPGTKWLKLNSFRDRVSGSVFDLVSLPGITRNYIPFELGDDHAFVYVQANTYQPAMKMYRDFAALPAPVYGGFSHQSLRVVSGGVATAIQDLQRILKDRVGLDWNPGSVDSHATPGFMLSPGASDEMVESYFINVTDSSQNFANTSGLQRFELNQVIAAAHTGSLADPALEWASYRILRQRNLRINDWFGAKIPLNANQHPSVVSASYRDAMKRASADSESTRFDVAVNKAGFLKVLSTETEVTHYDGRIESHTLEYAVPTTHSADTISAIPYYYARGNVYVGLEKRLLPAFERRGLRGSVLVTPAWRLKKDVKRFFAAEYFVKENFAKEFSANVEAITSLGQGYFPSIANSIEKVTPYAVMVSPQTQNNVLEFFPLSDLVTEVDDIPDIHTRISVLRLAHALGIL